jgi:hypothetical protein
MIYQMIWRCRHGFLFGTYCPKECAIVTDPVKLGVLDRERNSSPVRILGPRGEIDHWDL